MATARPGGELTVADLTEGSDTIRAALETVGGVWPMMVLAALGDGALRYGAIKEVVVGINDRMLSQTLHRLTRDGLVARTVVPTKRSCVEYELTGLGVEVRSAVTGFVTTILDLAPQVAAARARFDRSAAESRR